MMETNKYIIELEEMIVSTADGQMPLYKIKGFNTPTFDSTGVSKLTPYTEPDTEKVRKEAYDKGKNDAYSTPVLKEVVDEAYQRGLNDAWDAANKILELNTNARTKIFSCASFRNTIAMFSASEAIERIRQYEKEQEEIKVGDEIEWNGENYVATYIHCDNEYVDALDCSDGSVCDNLSIKAVKKTGRHFPEIAEVLRKMQEEKE